MKRAIVVLLLTGAAATAQWNTFGGDAQRTGWQRKESILNKDNASTLELKWKLQTDNLPKELTSLATPVVVDQVKTERGIKEYLMVAGSSDNLYAIDADTGKLVWKKTFTAEGKPGHEPNTLCPYALNATPAVQGTGRQKTVYVLSSDGKLHALNPVNGEDRFAPAQFVPAFSKNWSLNLVGNTIYTAISQRCNGVPSGVYAMELDSPQHTVHSFGVGRAGIWGRAGVAVSAATGTVFAETGDGPFDPSAGNYSDTFLALSAKDLKLTDYYTPANREWLTRKDLDMGCISPVVFEFQKKEYLVGSGKEGRLFLLDTSSLGGESHRKPLFRSELVTNEDVAYAAHGFWGSFATWEDAKQTRWLLAPAWGPPHSVHGVFPVSHGSAPHGSVMAFRVEAKDGGPPTLSPAWVSRDLNVPEPPIVANGIVLALSSGEDVGQADTNGDGLGTAQRVKGSTKAVLYALDAETGKELFSSGETMQSFTHFGGIAVSNGRVFVATYDGMVYSFGIKGEER